MKKFSKFLTIILTLALLVPMLGIASLAVEGEAGQTVSVSISLPNVYGLNGSISYSNPGLFDSVTVTNMSTKFSGDVTNSMVYLFATNPGTCGITVTAKIKAGAAVGDSCTITVTGDKAVDADGNIAPMTISGVITVKEPAPKRPTLDFTELLDALADGRLIDKVGYTTESFDALQVALANGQTAYDTAWDQATVDNAAKAIRDAIAALQPVDYTKLQEALNRAEGLMGEEKIVGLVRDMINAMNEGYAALTSGNQAEIDAAAAKIEAAILAVLEELENLKGQGDVDVTPETTPETAPVEPGDDHGDGGPFCNIPIHKLWPILFFISLLLNIALIIWIILIFKNKKEEEERKAEEAKKKANADNNKSHKKKK